jgi:hypothetical protein
VTTDPWEEGTFEGLERAQRRRVAGWSPEERLAWLEDAVSDLSERGLLVALREHKQRELLEAWAATQDQ